MIEFKADCGHMIQVAERDAGKIVKCAYCGREVEAPRRDQSDSAILSREVDLSELARDEGAAGAAPGLTIQGRQKKARGAPRPEDAGPPSLTGLRIALAAGFGVICLTVFILVAKSLVNFAKDPRSVQTPGQSAVINPQREIYDLPEVAQRTVTDAPTPPGAARPSDAGRDVADTIHESKLGRRNQTFEANGEGLFVETPTGSPKVYLRPQGSTHKHILGSDESECIGSGPRKLALTPGEYRVAVALSIEDSSLKRLPGFGEVGSRLKSGRSAAPAQEYLAADLSSDLELLHDAGGPTRLVRYYDVHIGSKRWTLLTSLFVPGKTASEILANLPSTVLYDFDRESARTGMEEEGVSHAELSSLLEVLVRAGQVAHRTPDGMWRVFEVDVENGSFRSYEIEKREAGDSVAGSRPGPPSQPVAGARSPWEPRRSGTSPTPQEKAPGDLNKILSNLRQRVEAGAVVNTAEWKAYLAGGAQYALWRSADVKTRTELVNLIDAETAKELVQEIGATLLKDVDLVVRLALLDALVRANQKSGIPIIDQRLLDLPEDAGLTSDQRQREQTAFEDARRKLSAAAAGKKRNPWER